MSTPSILLHHRALRWVAPVAVLGIVGLAASGMITAKATTTDRLPDTTTATLLADVRSTSLTGFSGTIVAQMSLGLPQLPALADSSGGSSIAGLLAGSHTMRVWYGGPDHQRVALLGATSETDVFHSGTDLWQWDSDTHIATHMVLQASGTSNSTSPEPTQSAPSPAESLTPGQLAAKLLATVDPSTRVTLGPNHVVADRSAYDLVLTPRDSATRVGSVHIAIDGSMKVPLGVQVFARGSSTAAIDVAFSDITFKSPPASYFRFAPPPGATVRSASAAANNAPHPEAGATAPGSGAPDNSTTKVTTIGKGWSSILEYHASAKQVDQVGGRSLSILTRVSGVWGRGRLLSSALVSVLVTDDGRVFAGSVDPAALYAAASAH